MSRNSWMGKGAFGPGVTAMAERRMFSKSIVSSARFLRMPQSSRLLYYDLGMAADDDGIVEAFTVIRTTGAAEDDLRVLAAKGFITVLNDDLSAARASVELALKLGEQNDILTRLTELEKQLGGEHEYGRL